MLQGPDGNTIMISRCAGIGDGNLAEYLALIAVLECALDAQVHHLVVHGDSRVVIDDVLGETPRPIRTAQLQQHRRTAQRLLAQFASVQLVWIPRVRNSIADGLARHAIEHEALNV